MRSLAALLAFTLAPVASGQVKNLVFNGTATCINSSCSSFGSGPITGNYSLDVVSQKIVGVWSFTTPFGVISSSQTGANAFIENRFGDINPAFSVNTSSNLEYVQFYFPGNDAGQIGRLATNLNSNACVNIPGGQNGQPACIADYVITGATTAAGQSFAYVPNLVDHTISAYSIDSSGGALTPITGSPFSSGSGSFSFVVHPSGRFAYVPNAGPNNITVYSINPSTGALTPAAGSPFSVGGIPDGFTLDPTGRFAYVSNYSLSQVVAFAVNATSGALMPLAGSPFAAGAGAGSIATDPSGKFVYVANGLSNNVSAYTINPNTGALTPVAGSPFAAGVEPSSVTVDPSGKFAFVANSQDGTISAFTIDPGSGALAPVPGSPFAAQSGLFSAAVDPSGQFLYVTNDAFNNVSAYSINPTTGALTPISGSPFATGQTPESFAIDPSGKFAYVNNFSDNTVTEFSINSSTGALSPIASSPVAAGSSPNAVATIAIVAQAPSVTAVLNAASSTVSLSPGVLAYVFGSNLNPGLSVTLNGETCSVLFASGTQLEIELPFDAPAGVPIPLAVSNSSGTTEFMVTLNSYAPAVFTTVSNGAVIGIFETASGQLTSASPASPGDTLTAFATGLGQTNPPSQLPSPSGAALVLPTFLIGGFPATVLSSGISPGITGVYEVNFVVPAGIQAGSQLVTMSIGGFTSPAVTIFIAPPHQTIAFGALANVPFGSAPFTVSATASSGLPVSFSSMTTGVCTVSGAMVTIVNLGTCTIQATQSGNASFAAATPTTESFAVTPGIQTISFGPLANQSFGAAPFNVIASASTGLPVSFASTTTSVCTVSGNTVTIVAPGTCTIQATQSGNATYGPAVPVNQSFQAAQESQAISFGTHSLAYVTGTSNVSVINTTTNTVTANVTAGTNPFGVAITPDGMRAYVTNSTANTVSVIDTGTNTITATIPVGSSPWGVAITPDGKHAYVTNQNSSDVSVIDTGTNTVIATVPETQFTRGIAIAPNGTRAYVVNNLAGNVSVIDTATNKEVASIAIGAGIQDIAITPDGTRAYIANFGAGNNGNVVVVNTATNAQIATITAGTNPYRVAISPDGTRAYAVNYNSANVSVINVATNTVVATVNVGNFPSGVAFTPDGTTAYVANSGDGTFSIIDAASDTVSATVPVGTGGPFGVAITPGIGSLPNQVFGVAPFTINAIASSGLPVGFASMTSSVCTVSGSTITVVMGGACTIQATQPGNANFAAAPPVNQTFQVTQAAQTIVFGSLSNQHLGGAAIALSASASSGLPVTFTSLTSAVCTVSGSSVTLVSVGTCTIQAMQAGSINFATAAPVSQSFQVLAGPPASISATGGTPQNAALNAAFASSLSATVKDAGGNPVSGVTVTFTAPASAASGSFAGGVNTALTNASGVATSATFTANGTGGSYVVSASALALTPATFSLTNAGIIIPVGLTVGLGASVPYPVTLASPAPSNGAFITLTSSDPSKVTITPSTVVIPAGAMVGSVTPKVNGIAFGSSSISAAAVGYPGAVQPVQVADTLSFSPNTLTVASTTTGHVFLFLSAQAPAGGFTINLSSSAPGIATVPATVTIPQSSNLASVAITGVGTGTAVIHASSSPFLLAITGQSLPDFRLW